MTQTECSVCNCTLTDHDDDCAGGLAYCGDCNLPVCAQHRTADSATRCPACAFRLSPAQRAAFKIACRDGAVCAGKSEHNGHVERTSASAIRALIARGLLVSCFGDEGGVAGRLSVESESPTYAELYDGDWIHQSTSGRSVG